jgi:type II restriction/modification system DNA methylase subunit YeeA
MHILSPTLNFEAGNIARIPLPANWRNIAVTEIVSDAVKCAKADWDSCETAWDFKSPPWIGGEDRHNTILLSLSSWHEFLISQLNRMKALEEENNRIFIKAYGLDDELNCEIPEDQITLYRPNQEEDLKRLISYAIGCMMGRYSLDKQGLIYANNGNESFDLTHYKTFPADQDGIIPVTETDWFEDDAANRFMEFIGAAWPKERLEENLKFVAESLDPNRGESPRETIRRYLATSFLKHHLSMYKKRPIYWLFSSGKQRAFQCLVYLHRYNEGTLSRMRTEYVIPLQGRISARIEQLAGDIAAATSTSHRKKLEKERDKLNKQQAELRTFDEQLRHYADQRISLDLDDGVKVNYGKFGDLLAEVKTVTGQGVEE